MGWGVGVVAGSCINKYQISIR